MPPLMKLWLDEVFSFGWAYGPGGQALQGKDLWLVASTGGPEESYRPDGHNRYAFDAFLPPYEQTAALTGMRWLPPLLLHGAHRVGDADLAGHARLFAERLASHPRWPGIDSLEPTLERVVPADARPPDPP
jgi:glutathione-regulated potassium-efflux system ancillary protein KefF